MTLLLASLCNFQNAFFGKISRSEWVNIRLHPPWGEQSTEHKTLSLCADVWNILCALNYNVWELSFYKVNAFHLFSVMLELLTQRKAVEKTGALHHVLKKEGVLSDPERLMTKAKKVSWFFEVYDIDEKKQLIKKLHPYTQQMTIMSFRNGVSTLITPLEQGRILCYSRNDRTLPTGGFKPPFSLEMSVFVILPFKFWRLRPSAP